MDGVLLSLLMSLGKYLLNIHRYKKFLRLKYSFRILQTINRLNTWTKYSIIKQIQNTITEASEQRHKTVTNNLNFVKKLNQSLVTNNCIFSPKLKIKQLSNPNGSLHGSILDLSSISININLRPFYFINVHINKSVADTTFKYEICQNLKMLPERSESLLF